jgi:twitching motility protein PilT
MRQDVQALFQEMVRLQSSDLILRTGERPVARVEGHIRFLSDTPFTTEQGEDLLASILAPQELAQFRITHEKDTAVTVEGAGRFRANMLQQRRQTAFVFRYVKEHVPGFEDLHLPTAPMQRLAMLHRGLVLVTGIAGSGKSTTLAGIIQHMNKHTHRHVVTIEDPIEYMFRDGTCAVMQREIGIDTADYHTALKAVVRQTPDVILVGEMRDHETVSAALSAAETGHLVLATLHTVNAVQTVERIISFFPPHQHATVRLQLALVLEGVVSQRLITRRSSAGRVPAVEILLGTPTVKEMILEGRTRELAEALDDGHDYYGTQTFNRSLVSLVQEGLIEYDDALSAADNPDELKLALRGISKGVSTIEATYGGQFPAADPAPPAPPEGPLTPARDARFSGTSRRAY